MAKVIVLLKVYPEGSEVDLEKLLATIKEKLPSDRYEVVRSEEEPIAFGLKALRLYVVMEEATEGGTMELEELVRQADGVSEVEVEAVHRLSGF